MFCQPYVRIAATVAAATVAGGVLAACTGSSGGGTAASGASTPVTTKTATITASPSASTTTPSVAGGATGNSASGSGGGSATSLSLCLESQLRASLDPRPVSGSSTHGDLAIIVDFQNTSGRACLIRGYPGAALVDSSGNQVKQAARTIRGRLLGLPVGQDTLPTVTLRPGAYASAGIEGVNEQEQGAAQAGCDGTYYPRILVTPPNTRIAVPFTQKWPICYSFTVHPTNTENNPPG